MTVGQVCVGLVRHPIRAVVHRWHWKGAALSAVTRGALFFATNISGGPRLAVRAMLVEAALGVPLAGVLAAVTQAFGRAEPAWAGALAATILLPLVAHPAELVVHWAAGTPNLGASIAASVSLSVVSTAFSLFAVRRGVMVVGDGSKSLGEDLKRLPRLVADFVLLPPRALGRALRALCGGGVFR